MGEGRNVYRVSVGKPEGKRPLERPLADCCECGDEPSGSGATELVSGDFCIPVFR
jgi:hypothetical protein